MNGDATRTTIGAGRILADGTRLADRYRIRQLLGVGAMGMVYLAHDERLDLDVAVKVLRPNRARSARHAERFRSELLLARQISHRNVVRIHDIGQSGELTFISMDYVDGQSLKQLLETGKRLAPERAVAFAADLADALDEAHRSGVVHRDLKPANVMIAGDRALLTDFGIATSLHDDGLTQSGEIVGTLDYLSPEQARGQAVDGRADIYALGLLLFEMLCGELPFRGKTVDEALAVRTFAQPAGWLRQSPLPANLQPLLEQCLATDPDDRYADAATLAAELRKGGRRRRSLKGRKLRPLLAATAVVALLVAGGQALLHWQGDNRSAAATPIAVLPFEIALEGGDKPGIGHGLAELLAEQLGESTSTQLVANERVATTLRDLKLQPAGLPASEFERLGDLLDARYLVASRLLKIDDAYYLEARLRTAATGELRHRSRIAVTDAAGIYQGIAPLADDLLRALELPLPEHSLTANLENPAAMAAYVSGVEYLQAGNPLAAVEPLREAVSLSADFALAHDRLAGALAALGRDTEALAAANNAVAALGKNSGRAAVLVRARRAALAGDGDAAIGRLQELLASRPDDNAARLMLAKLHGDAGRFQEAGEALLRLVDSSPDHPRAWFLLGKYSILGGDAQRAADDYLVRAQVIQNRLGNAQGRADVLNALGIAQAQLGNVPAAADYYRQALELRRDIGDERGVAAVLANLARIELGQGRYDEARKSLVSARDTLQAIGDRWTTANLENELGFLEEQRGRFDAALAHYRASLRIRRDLGDQRALAESYNNVGYVYYLLGDYDNAVVFSDRSLEIYRDTGNREGVMLTTQMRGILDTARGRYDDALKALLESLRIAREQDHAQAEAVAQGYIGRVQHLQGRYAAAAESYDVALRALADLDDERGLAEFLLQDARLSIAMGAWDTAAAAIDRAGALIDRDENPARRALQLRTRGALFAASGRRQEAADSYAAALQKARASGDRVAVLRTRLAIASNRDAGNLSELRSLQAEAEQLGHGELAFKSRLALAAALLSSGEVDEAESVLRAAMQGAHARSRYEGKYRLHLLLADVYDAQSRADAASSELQLASIAVDEALTSQNAGQRRAFVKRHNVRRVLDLSGQGNDIG